MKFCGKCGTKLEDSARFCPKCGEMSEDLSQLAPEPVPVKKKSKKLPILAAIALVLVVVVVVTLLIPKKETVYLLTSQTVVNERITQETQWDYDEEGKLLRYAVTTRYPNGDATRYGSERVYTYDSQGRLDELVCTSTATGADDQTTRYDYRYSGDRLISCYADEVSVDFILDDDGNVTGRTVEGNWNGYEEVNCSYYGNGSMRRGELVGRNSEYSYFYNEDGIIRSYESKFYGEVSSANEYNEYGHPTYMVGYDMSVHNDTVERTLVSEVHVSYTYKKGEITEFTLRDQTGTAHCEVLSAGHTKTYKLSGSSDLYGDFEVVCEHDAQGNLLEQVTYSDGEMLSKVVYTYEAFDLPKDYVFFNTLDPKYMIN